MSKETGKIKVESMRKSFIELLPDNINKIEKLVNKIIESPWEPLQSKELIYELRNLHGFNVGNDLNAINEISRNSESIIEQFLKNNKKLTLNDKKQLKTSIDALINSMNTFGNRITNRNNFTSPPSSKTKSNTPLIMVVDEDHKFCDYLGSQLETLGYKIKYVYSLDYLKQSISTYNPRAIFMDIKLENIDNANAKIIQNLLSNGNSQCKIIYMSDIDDINSRLSAIRSGGEAFLNKSLSLNELKNTIDLVVPLRNELNHKVMLIDDDEMMNAYCAAILEKEAIKTLCLKEPKNIFKSIMEFNPDVILLDMYMPNINGLEMSALIRQHQIFASIPIVIMSGETDINKQFMMRSVGADDFILKPFKPNHLVNIVFNRIKRSKQNKKLIISDGLTGLTIFSKIKDRIFNLIESCIRYNLDFSMAFIDLDKFKNVNDIHGHLIGDQVLQDFSEFLVSRVRKSDIVTRYGGEEFAIILPYTSPENAFHALDEIRRDYAKKIHKSHVGEFNVTFSAGISSLGKCNDLGSLLSAADETLYTCKKEGGNIIQINT